MVEEAAEKSYNWLEMADGIPRKIALVAYGWALSVKPTGWEVEDRAAKRLVQILLALTPFAGQRDLPSILTWRAAKAILKVGYPLPPDVKLF